MTKYLNDKFAVAPGQSEAYRNNYDAIFRRVVAWTCLTVTRGSEEIDLIVHGTAPVSSIPVILDQYAVSTLASDVTIVRVERDPGGTIDGYELTEREAQEAREGIAFNLILK